MKYTLQELMDMKGTSEPVRHALQAMSDEVEALRQDAERYRWLRENKFIWSDFGYTGQGLKKVVGLEFEWFETDAKKPSRKDLDAVIDAAIRARGMNDSNRTNSTIA
jgi:hypothetical protein